MWRAKLVENVVLCDVMVGMRPRRRRLPRLGFPPRQILPLSTQIWHTSETGFMQFACGAAGPPPVLLGTLACGSLEGEMGTHGGWRDQPC